MMTGCSSKPLAKLEIAEGEELVIDVRDDFDPTTILGEITEGTEVSYELDQENSKVIITLVNGDKTETLETQVIIQYPLGNFVTEDITIDLNEGYDVKELINVDADTEVTEVLDEEKGILTITLTNGDRTETIETPVNVIKKEPTSRTYTLANTLDCGDVSGKVIGEITFYSDGTTLAKYTNGNSYRGSYGDDWIDVGAPAGPKTFSFSEDKTSFSYLRGYCTNGGADKVGGTLISENYD